MTEAVLTDEELAVVQELQEARRQSNAWDKLADAAKDKLKALAAVRGSDVALTASGDPAFHLLRTERKGVNAKKLEAKYPEVYADVAEVIEIVKVEVDL